VRPVLWSAAAVAGCAMLPPRTEILSRSPSFKAQTVVVAAFGADPAADPEVSRALAAAARSAGLRALPLEAMSAALPGAVVSPDVLCDPRTLTELRRSSGVDAVVLVALDPSGTSARLTALDARTGDAVLRATLRPRGESFTGAAQIAQAAAAAIAELSSAPPARLEDLPVP